MAEARETVERIYELFRNGDIDGVLALCAPDVTITQDPALPWGGRYVGRDGVVEFATKLTGTIESVVTTLALFEAGDVVVQYGRTAGTVRANGAAFDIPECHLWTVRDGVVAEVLFSIDSRAMNEALSS